jgi:hypothetical protein
MMVSSFIGANGRADETKGFAMNDATLNEFRNIADQMRGNEPADWQWIGKWESQRMFGITEKRAKEYAARHGGEAKKM